MKWKFQEMVADSGKDYELFSVLNGLHESIDVNSMIPAEANLDLLNFISMSKGCYIGQELVARTQYKVWINVMYSMDVV
jgi:folate-binding protein YgfZ